MFIDIKGDNMYAAIRVILVFLVLVVVLKKVNFNKTKRIVVIVLTILTCTFSYFLPVENLLVDFSCPEKVYKYMCLGNDEIKTVVYGEKSAMVIAEKSKNTYNILFVPQSKDGWRIGNTMDTVSVYHKATEDFFIDVKKYSNTDDYYITVNDIGSKIKTIKDLDNSEFVSLVGNESDNEKQITFYYASIQNFNEQYWIEINGEKICLGE